MKASARSVTLMVRDYSNLTVGNVSTKAHTEMGPTRDKQGGPKSNYHQLI